jgi:hypothetical protein
MGEEIRQISPPQYNRLKKGASRIFYIRKFGIFLCATVPLRINFHPILNLKP